MDEAIGDEVVELVDGRHVQHKENEFSIKPGSSNMLQSNELVMPCVDDYPEKSKNPYSGILDAKDAERIGSSEHASASPRCMDSAGITVEELTLRNYDGDRLTIVGTSSNREWMQTRQNQWQNLYQITGGSGISSLRGQTGCKGKGQATVNAQEDGGNNLFSGLIDQNQPLHNHSALVDNFLIDDDKSTSGGNLCSSGGIWKRILSKSGHSEYFIKSTLRGKGLIHKSQAYRGSGTECWDQDHPNSGIVGLKHSVAPFGSTVMPVSPCSYGFCEPQNASNSRSIVDGISLREWLELRRKKANKVEKMHIFRKVVDLVDFSHSRGVSLQELMPSRLKLSGLYQVTYLGSFIRAVVPPNVNQAIPQLNHNRNEKRPIQQTMLPLDNHTLKKRKFGENMNLIQRWPQFPSRPGIRSTFENVSKDSANFVLEERWYSSPELSSEKNKRCTFASNIYCLGVLLFELLGSFDFGRSHAAAMLDLRHRILPRSFLSENPKEAGFCLWLLHPEPSLRPTTREILQSEFVSGIQESSEGALSSIDEEDGETELLLYFLSSLNEQKQKDASNLLEQLQRIEADIQEVEKRRPKKSLVLSSFPPESFAAGGSSYTHQGNASLDSFPRTSTICDTKTRLTSNIRKLENAYFTLRSHITLLDSNLTSHRDGEMLRSNKTRGTMGKEAKYNSADHLGGFFDGFCKYARYRNFRVRGVLRNGGLNNSANVICSLSFDRDEDYLAAGGVSKKIKIFEFQALFNDSVDFHYPVVEMSNKSKLCCISWNSYIRNYLASADYDGIVKLWDAATGQEFSHFIEHSQRAWSVDFSRGDPTKLISGSDDRLVKIWSINEKNSLCTIRNNANVCCVQFSAHSPHLLAFSSADYKTYCYDVRNVSTPWCLLAGHEKTVSYAKFLDSETVVSASTDNTLKIWDLKKTSSNSLSRDACILTLRGHTNEKNFVGLSVADGYIACGSETNEVFSYYKSLPMPITAHKLGSVDPMTGKETEDDNGQFVSSVCWGQKSNMVVATNSSGCIKLLQMV